MLALNQKITTPLQPLVDETIRQAGVELYMKREDLIHPQISGNKWRKLKYNLLKAKETGCHTLLTFGGAYSNHIYAVAAAGKLYNFQTIGLIRGEERLPLNPTLSFAVESGMHLHNISREIYRMKDQPDFLAGLREKHGNFYMIPEGGSNPLAVKGCAEIVEDIHLDFDYLCCPCGTGGTLAGLIAGITDTEKKLLGFSALKGGHFLENEVSRLVKSYHAMASLPVEKVTPSWYIQTDYHFGGYAKTSPELMEFIRSFEAVHNICIEQVYTGKMLYGLYDLMRAGYFKKGEILVVLHTGGLQGRSPKLDQV